MIIIPSTLPGIIEPLHLSRIQTENVYRLTGYIISRYAHTGTSFTEPLPISVKHFRENLGTHYLPYVKIIRDLGLLDSTDKYYYYQNSNIKGECKKYVFNQAFIFSDPILTAIEKRAVKITGDFQTVETSKLLTQLRIDVNSKKILSTALKQANVQFYSENVTVGNDIPPGFYKIPGRKTALKLDFIKERAAKTGKEIILYRGKCYLSDSLADFSIQKVLEFQYQYAVQIANFKKIQRNRKFVTCRRNTTNNRLDTNLTTLKNSFVPLLKFTGSPLNSIDLSNSQFLIFLKIISYILEYSKYPLFTLPYTPTTVTQFIINKAKKSKIINCKSVSYRALQKCVKNGTFYEVITAKVNAQNTGIVWDRGLTKKTLFQVIFSGYQNNSTNKQILRRAVPELVWLADTFKQGAVEFFKSEGFTGREAIKRGNNFLPIYLQKVESNIFIDVILKDLLQKGYKVFTKHDSILCKQEDFILVYEAVNKHLSNIFGFGGYHLKIENKTF